MRTVCKFFMVIATACLAVTPAFADRDIAGESARPTPAWVRDAVIYEIFTRNFSDEGTFNAVTARLDELKDLGVNILWIMPIQPIGKVARKGGVGSPYAISDYYAIDPTYGTADDLKRLIAESHRRGFKVIMDLVADHTAWDSVMIAHPDFYKQDASGKVLPPVPGWTDVAGLNYANPALREYMIAMMKHWIADFGFDGFRCDVADMVPTDFWEQARVELEKVKPGVFMLAEASKPELLTKAFDLDYAWPMLGTLNHVLIDGAPASDLQATWEENRHRFPKGALHMRMSDDHDEARAIAKFGLRGALAAQVFMLTLDGVPMFYNGMEVGDATESGDPALFEKLPVFWHPKERPPLRMTYRDLIEFRKTHAAFRNNEVTWVRNSHPANVITFTREADGEQFLVVINFSNRPTTVKVEVNNPAAFKPVRVCGASEPAGFDTGNLKLGAFEWRIYQR
jgi:cyclomaltodextrinase / maltogenic alpha-amylase / neopullulanase